MCEKSIIFTFQRHAINTNEKSTHYEAIEFGSSHFRRFTWFKLILFDLQMLV